jgi:hypothetical protein
VKLRLLLGMCVLGLASACGGDSGNGGGGGGGGSTDEVRVTLEEQNNSGKSGTADLFPGAASVDVTIEIRGTSDLDPIHVHNGTCASPGEEIVHDLGFTTANLGQGQIFDTMENVATGEFVIDIHDDMSDEVIMCGAIPAQ